MFISIVRAVLFVSLFVVSSQALAAKPTVITVDAGGLTTSSAVLNGTGTPNGEPTTGRFRYSATDPGTCDDTFGTRVPAVSGTDLGTGTSAVPYSITTTGLTPGVTYYFCAIVTNASGTAFGAIRQFTIPSFPVVLTVGAINITSASATLQGAANPVAATTTGWFRYSTTDPVVCNDTFGSRTPSSGGFSLGSGIVSVPYQQPISGLTPGTTYYYCAIANNSYGNGVGTVRSFTTPAQAPTVTTNGATMLTRTTGTLTAYANPGGNTTTGWFRYHTASPGTCNDTFGTRAPGTGGAALGAGTSSTPYSQAITGLAPGTTYYYCALASNGIGTSWGAVVMFVTPSAPSATTVSATYITSTTAQLNGAGNPNRANTAGWFRYALTNPGTCDDKFGSRAPETGSVALGNDIYDTAYSQAISGLSGATTYYYCAIVASSEGTAFGSILTFTTSAPAQATTSVATSITSTSATLNGLGNPNGAPTSGWFRYSTTNPGICSDAFGSRLPSSGGTNLGGGTAAVPFSVGVSSLLPGATYYFCAIVSNGYGTGFGSVLSFTTPTTAPTVITNSANNLTRTTGVLTGYGTPGGDATIGWFRYSTSSPGSCNDTFGTRAPTMSGVALGAGTSNVPFSQAISGLAPATTYYFCAFASNSAGLAVGSVGTFVTPASPTVMTTVATSLTSSSAQLNALGNPKGASAVGWFRYGLTNPGTCDDKFGSRAPFTAGTYLGNDIYDSAFYQPISGLSSGTTYYYCAIISSNEGTAFGAILSFTTSGAATATTTVATSVTATSAVLNGTGNPTGATASGWFRYSTTNPTTCNDTFGTRYPSSSGASLGSATANVPYAYSVSGLLPGATYYFCAIVSNTYGVGFGTVLSFTTPTTAPTVITNSANNLTSATGVLTGYGNPGGDATVGWFRFSTSSPGTCNDTFGTRAPLMGGVAMGSGNTNVSFSQAISGLAPATTYYFCALASNSSGLALGLVGTFVTPAAPTALTAVATSITSSSAQLNGSGNPKGASAMGWFRYSLTNPGTCDDKFGSRAPLTSGTFLGNDIYDSAFYQPISGLSSGTTYYYCAIVSSTEGTAFGAILSFTTSGAATATTTVATSITATSAVLNGTGNPTGAAAMGWFRYSTTNPTTCNDTFGTRYPSSSGASLGSATANVPYAYSVSGLLPGATYYFCAIVSNTYGVGFGTVLSFTTPTTAPTVITNSANNLTSATGVLTGYGNPGGDATVGWFRFSTSSPGTCNDTFGTRAPLMAGVVMGSGNTNVSFSQAISGLAPATTYYFCALASNSSGLALGAVGTFVTPAAPTALTTVATSITSSSAQLNGLGNPKGASAVGWFRYGLTNPGTCDDKFGSRAPLTAGTYLGNDIYDSAFYQPISGLSSGTTYYYCAIVSSTEGTAFGSVLSFTTSGAATATTAAATGITASSATLNGAGNPTGAVATGWFRYSSTTPTTCNDTFGTRVPSSTGANLGSGTAGVPYSMAISGLLPGVTYYFCAIASNTYGTGFGAVLSFTTPTAVPTVSTNGATNLTRTTGLLTGSANPGGDATTGWFRYSISSPGTCNDTFGTRAPTMGGASLGSGTGSVAFSQAITGLTKATTYYYCAIATNSVGTAWGTVQTFITPSEPTALTLATSAITNSSATLNGSGNPNRGATNGWFRYALTNPGTCDDKFGSRAPTTGGVYLGSDVWDSPYSVPISGLSSGTTYYYCAIVSSTEGTAFGAVMSFVTSGPATATTVTATSVASTTATLNGTGNPNGATATGWFRFSTTSPGTCSDAFGTRAPSSGSLPLGSGITSVPFGQPINGLAPGVTYYYCAIANNTYGSGFGAVMQFTTPASPPSVSTDYPTGIATTLNGSANPNGAATTGWFRMATTSPGTCNDTFGTRVPTTAGTVLGAGSTYVSYANPAPGLVPGTTYFYCAIASNALGTSFGTIRSFTAPMPPAAVTLAATPITATTATLNGTANPNGNSTTGWFRFSASNPGTCNDVFGTRAPISGGSSLGAGTTTTPFLEALSGLAPATTYYFCAIASSAYGTSLGGVLSFTTPPASTITKGGPGGESAPPASPVTTNAASDLAEDSAVLHGAANPEGNPITGWFRYDTVEPQTCSDKFGTRAPTHSGTELGAGAKAVEYSQSIRGLAPGTTYYFCAIAGGTVKTSFGAVLSFTTKPATLRVTTEPPTEVAADAAVLNGAVVPNGDSATGWFRYGTKDPGSCNDSFGSRAPDSTGQALGSGVTAVSYAVAISGLTPGTTYYYCALASGALGTKTGELLHFVAGAGAPIVDTESATDIDPTSGTIRGTVDHNGSATTVWFRYGESDPGTCDEHFGSRLSVAVLPLDNSLVAGPSPGHYAVPLTALKPDFTYYYCVAASNLGGAKFGQVRTFTTAPELVMGTVHAAAATVDPPVDAGGCSYQGRGNSSLLSLLAMLPLAGLLLLRRRRNQKTNS